MACVYVLESLPGGGEDDDEEKKKEECEKKKKNCRLFFSKKEREEVRYTKQFLDGLDEDRMAGEKKMKI